MSPRKNGTIVSTPALQFQSDLIALIPHLRAFSRMLCHNKDLSEEIAQDALAKAWGAKDHFQPGTNLKAWVFTILRNEFYSKCRRAWRHVHWDDDDFKRVESAPDQQIWASELSVVAQMLRGLPDGQREALILIGAGGFSYEEAAEICSVPIGTMKSRAARGRAALQSALDGTAPLTRAAPTSTATEDILEQLNAITAERASVN